MLVRCLAALCLTISSSLTSTGMECPTRANAPWMAMDQSPEFRHRPATAMAARYFSVAPGVGALSRASRNRRSYLSECLSQTRC